MVGATKPANRTENPSTVGTELSLLLTVLVANRTCCRFVVPSAYLTGMVKSLLS